jgi:hypothetical protein
MALSAFVFEEECVAPNYILDLKYLASSPENFRSGGGTLAKYSATDGVLSLGDNITIPVDCGGGIDIVFAVDYTGSMGSAIENVKTGIANILSTIDAESSGNFRIGLVVFDENNTGSSPSYVSKTAYTSLPESQRIIISSNANKRQYLTCVSPLGNVGSTSAFQNQLSLLNNSDIFPLGNGRGAPEPGGLAINAIANNGLAGSFRSDAIKVVVLITDDVPGGDDDTNNSIDASYFTNTLVPMADSLDIQVLVQSTLSRTSGGNYYNGFTNTSPAGRYDQVSFSNANWINTGLIAGIQALCGESYIGTCEPALTGWYYQAGAWSAWYYNSSSQSITNQSYFTPSYTVYSDKSAVGEGGETITWYIETFYVPTGTTLYWSLISGPGNANASDFTQNTSSGSFIINTTNAAGNGYFQLTTRADVTTEGPEYVQVYIRTGSTSGTIVATADPVTISDTSKAPTPVPPTPTPSTYVLYLDAFEGGGTSRSTDLCNLLMAAVYSTSRQYATDVRVGDYIWRNSSATAVFNGGGLWYAIGNEGGVPVIKVQITAEGYIANIADCPSEIQPTATPTPTPTSAPPVINNFRGVGVSLDEIETLWDSVTGATGNLTITWGINGSYTNVGSGTSNNFNDGSFNLESLSPNTNYYIRMTAANAGSSTSATTIVKTESELIAVTSGAGAGPTPTPTPTPTATTYQVYTFDPCDGVSSYVHARSINPVVLFEAYSLSGSEYADQNYTAISWDYSPTWDTWVLDAALCDGDGGDVGGKCLIEGTMVQLADGTQTAIETLVNDQSLASVVVGNMPDTDTVSQLLSWSQINPVLSNTTTNLVNKVEYTVDSVINFNNNLITSSKDHLHIIKRSGTWMISKASDILVGDVFIDKNYNEIQITSIQELTGSYKVYKLNVETNDTFIANGIITHNSKIMP